MAESGQTYANHARLFPLFHYVASPILGLNVLWTALEAWHAPSVSSVWAFVVAFGLVATLLASRFMALAVQDRVIRLEMRLRLRQILPADLQARIPELSRSHLVALRFASDAELPELVRRVLSGDLKSSTEIKQAVKDWQGDYLRA